MATLRTNSEGEESEQVPVMTVRDQPRIPLSTYRLQFNRSFTFTDAKQLLPYLHALGVSDCYTSPYLKATPGSTHGYDVVDPTQLNPELGSEKEYQEFVDALHHYDMGQILDVVPNHMGIDKLVNPWWLDVLENGPSSPFAAFFDIDWNPIKRELENKVLLPILGDLYGKVLENLEITLSYEAGAFHLCYYDSRLPVDPKTWIAVLTQGLENLTEQLGLGHHDLHELQSVMTALQHLPPRHERDPQKAEERRREKEIIKRRLASLTDECPPIFQFIQGNVRVFNGTKGDPQSLNLLHELIDAQGYRLAYWRVASEEINYRRFFDVNDLVAIRMEEPRVFEQFHALVFRLLKEGAVTGLRIDHVDGLNDPGRYVRQLQAWARRELGPPEHTARRDDRGLFVVVEKILGRDETLPEDWPVFGTTGYDFLNYLNGLFVNSANERALDEVYHRFIHRRINLDDLLYESKKLITRVSMAGESNTLGHQLNRLSERHRWSRDFTLYSLTYAIREIIACFPVYRTYITENADAVTERDRAYITRAVAKAKRKNPAQSGLVFDFVRDLLLNPTQDDRPEDREDRVQFIMKFQQFTSPVIAKGIEDTAFYIYNRLVSLNEVGGELDRFGIPPATFHKWLRERQGHWPHALSATSTHDSKRSEDVRARINVLSEIPKAWKAQVMRWSRLNRKYKTILEGGAAPDPNEEYLLYQTLVGVWPLEPMDDVHYRCFCDRIQNYMAKALKEAKVNTSWINPDLAYDAGVHSFLERILDRGKANPFLEEFLPFQAMIAEHGMTNSLSQLLVKNLAPGIPDFYQGTELWDLHLVDPDNRHPVDFALRSRLLAEIQEACAAGGGRRLHFVQELLDSRKDSRIKLYLTMSCLQYRRTHVRLCQEGDYVPLDSSGGKGDHVCAFARMHGEEAVVVVVPRLVAGLLPDHAGPPLGPAVWGDTVIAVPSWRPASRYRNVLTGEVLSTSTADDRQTLPLGEVLRHFPVAMLERLT